MGKNCFVVNHDLVYFQVNYLLGKQAYFGKTASEVNSLVLDLVSLTQCSVITQPYQLGIGVAGWVDFVQLQDRYWV